MRFNGDVIADGVVTGSNLSGSSSGTNTGDQAVANTSDATSHTVALSASGGSVKLVEGANVTLTTTGTAGDGIVTIAATSTPTAPAGSDGFNQYNNGGAFGATDQFYDDVTFRHGVGMSTPASKMVIKSNGNTSVTSALNVTDSSDATMFFVRDDGGICIGGTDSESATTIRYVKNTTGTARFIVENTNGGSGAFVQTIYRNDSGDSTAGQVGVGPSTATSAVYANRLFIASDIAGISYEQWKAGGDFQWFGSPAGGGNGQKVKQFQLSDRGNILLGTDAAQPASAIGAFAVKNGTVPSADVTDQFSMYSADQAGGNACLHTRTESGQIIKLFQGSALTAQDTTITHDAPGTPDYALSGDVTNVAPYGLSTSDQVNTVLQVIANLQTRVGQLEARLQAHGLIA